MKRVLFLCMGNICRSPAAHCVFQNLVNQAGLDQDFEIESAGTIGFHQGKAPDSRMQRAMRARNIPIIGRSKQLDSFDMEYFDLILAMDKENFDGAISIARGDVQRAKVKLFCNYCTEHEVSEVPDPYYGGDRGFEDVMDLIEDGCQGLLRNLTE